MIDKKKEKDKIMESVKSSINNQVTCARSGTIPDYPGGVTAVGNTNLYYAMGTFKLNATGITYGQSWLCNQCESRVKIVWKARDDYNWHAGLYTDVCGVLIPDDYALELRGYGPLEFEMKSKWTDSYCSECH